MPKPVRIGHLPIEHILEKVVVSTVCIDSAADIYETLVLLDGRAELSLFRKRFKNSKAARRGHKVIVMDILSKKLALAIPVTYLANQVL